VTDKVLPKSYPAEVIHNLLDRLLDAALAADEFEYCCALLRPRGIEPAGWDSLAESNVLVQQILSVASAPIQDDLRVRLSLFLYCHTTEMDSLYDVPMNLLRIVEGHRWSGSPFHRGSKAEPKYPSEKVGLISAVATSVGHTELGDFYEWMLVRQVRNAFFHSDYSLLEGDFVIYRGEPVKIGNEINRVVPLDWLVARLEAGINLGLALIDRLTSRRETYKAPKTIKSPRAQGAGFGEVTLLVDQRGLIGFETRTGAV
jgi:hypothetical protein